ncbi:hypothetical protein WMY93_024966 [Mugilogobius chulae]|uniref:Uncharacterized protein n=1 Tax=Mugilogobius chulae TaxID=88201 RepID=A0AAW0N177_9GOBI
MEASQRMIRSAITAVFPDLSAEVLTSLEDTLKALGTETAADLQYITEKDLRQDINKGMSIHELKEQWPLLFNDAGMAAHYKELVGKNLFQTFFDNVDAPKCKPVLNRLIRFQSEKSNDEGCSEEIIQMVLLLMAHFQEEEELLFHFVEDTCLAQEVQLDKLPMTPCIIVCGSSCFAARTFMLSVDSIVVNDHVTSFTSALCLMFGSFYCFNIHYPVELRSTLEFLQRSHITKLEWTSNILQDDVPQEDPWKFCH